MKEELLIVLEKILSDDEVRKAIENNNLKEDFKRHIDRINELTERSDNLQEENERLKVKLENKLTPDELVSMINQELVRQNKDYKSRNEKAIKYIKSFGGEWRNYSLYYNEIMNKLSKILQGEDKE